MQTFTAIAFADDGPEYLHEDDAWVAAWNCAAAELLAVQLDLDHEEPYDGCLLPGRTYTYRASTSGKAALQITAVPASGGGYDAAVTGRYSHAVGELDASEYESFHASLDAAIAAAEQETRHRSGLRAVYALANWQEYTPAALVLNGTIYRA
jgi:hypothetical protein